MKKIRLLFAAVLSMMAWTGAVAQTDAEYEAALAAITDGGTYRIFTEIDGSKYYVTTGGYLAGIADAGKFTFEKVDGGEYKSYGFKIKNGSARFTNTSLSNSKAVLNTGRLMTTTGNDRNNWEAQVFFLKDGKYAIRATNSAYGETSWADAGRVFWTWKVEDVPVAEYSYDPNYVWQLETPSAAFNVTFNLYFNGEKVASKVAAVEPGFATLSSLSYADDALFTYSCDKETIADGDTEINVTATWKGLFDFSTDYENAVWYYANLRGGKWLRADESNKDANGRYTTNSINEKTDAYKWAFIGNPFAFTIVNKAAGNDKVLAVHTSLAPTMKVSEAVDTTLWIAAASGEGFSVRSKSGATMYINDASGAGNLGFWNSSYGATDAGSRWAVEEVPAAVVNVTYNVVINGQIVASATDIQAIGAEPVAPVQLNHSLIKSFTYDVETLTAQTTTVNATPTLLFEASKDYASAHWYDMAMRGTWYVTTDNLAEDGAYKSVNANAVGLVKDAYQWAFVGNPYDGFKVLNKAAGDGYSFGYTENALTTGSGGIPTVMADNEGTHVWAIAASTSGISNSFTLNVPGTNLYINQYGGAGGSLKFWNSTANVSDVGSAFTVMEVPTNFAEFTASIEALLTSEATGYFTYNEATRALWKEEYKTNCPYDTYVTLQAAVDNPDNLIWPATGYYRFKSANYGGRYVTYADVEGTPTVGTAVSPEPAIANIVKLTALGDKKYNIAIEGLNVTAPAQSQLIGLADEGAEMTAVVTTPGVGTFTSGGIYSAIHCAASSTPAYYCVGWTSDAAASQWIIEDIADFSVALNAAEDKSYATFNAPFGVTLGGDVKAYAITLETNAEGDWAVPTEIGQQVPANTPVLLVSESAAASVTATINDAAPAVNVANVLKGTNVEAAPSAYVLNAKDGVVGFYALGADGKLGANKAYLEKAAGDNGEVKALKFDIATAIKAVNAAENASVFNLAGQRVNKAQKGIYIVNGKKVVK